MRFERDAADLAPKERNASTTAAMRRHHESQIHSQAGDGTSANANPARPKCAPCVSLSIQIGAGALTADPDYDSFGIAYYSPRETSALRGHARAAVTELKLTIGAAGALALSGAMFVGAVRLFRRVPPILQVLGAFAVIGALRNERRPEWIGRMTHALGDLGREFLDDSGPHSRTPKPHGESFQSVTCAVRSRKHYRTMSQLRSQRQEDR
jgi:hypothetical protein